MKATWAALLALLLAGAAQAEVAVPPLGARVTDLTATLGAQQAQALESRFAAFEKKKGAQLAVLIVPSTQPETIEQFALRVAEAWKLGRKGVNDGALLLVAKDDRALRIEVGYGLEGALNDATAKRIIAETITPFFKRGEFYAGIDAGTAAMMRVIDGEPLPVRRSTTSAAGADTADNIIVFVGGSFLILLMGNIILRQFLGRLQSGVIIAGMIGSLAWTLLASLAVAGLSALLALVFSLMFGMKTSNRARNLSAPGQLGGRSVGGWSSGGRDGVGIGGGLSGGGFGGGGDFSGGGGEFGGGGASGDW